jgi:malonyl-CoA O-methyltransferase
LSLTPLDKKAVRRSFERAAPSYDRHAVLQREVESRLLERIEFQRVEPQSILDLGCGTGSASRQLATRYRQAVVLALDWATAMLAKSGNAPGTVSGQESGPHPVCADMHAIPLASRSVDLVFSNLALQWSYDLPAVFSEFRRIMRADSMLIFSCYGPDTLFELKQSWREVDDFQHVNDHPDMHDIGDELMAAGFREPVMDAEHLTVDHPDLMSLMHDLKGTGERNAASHRFTGLTGKGRLNRLSKAYEQYRRNDRYPASYEVIYGAAYAPAEGQPVKTPDGDVATFSVDALRSR